MSTPRPDQHHAARPGAAGSRSGSGDVAAALGYPGSPPAVPNCQSAQALRRSVGGAGLFFTFSAPGRIWTVMLAYTVVAGTTFLTPARFAATITTAIASLPLGVVELSLATTNQHDSGICALQYNGLPLVGGDSLLLNINGGIPIIGADQEASAVVLYSIP